MTSPSKKNPKFVDLQIYGGYGIDFMFGNASELESVAKKFYRGGLSAFLATTISSSPEMLLTAVNRLGHWITSRKQDPKSARPLGIHIEGPFIHPKTRGVHPESVLRPALLPELDRLWDRSQGTIKMMTVAPEVHSPKELKALCKWALSNKVVLSIGHSDATEDEARAAFDLGFKSVTHAWNAMPFTHRNPGILAAALGRKDVYLGVIPDGLHVHTAMARFAFEIAPKNTYFISDAAPALGLKKGQTTTFGPLTIFLENGASRIKGGALSGGGRLLSESYPLWVKAEAKRTRNRENLIFKHAISACTTTPLKLLGLKK